MTTESQLKQVIKNVISEIEYQKTLVIHPKDTSTDFLYDIYENHKDWNLIDNCNISDEDLANEIKQYDRIIMLGHGCGVGLLNMMADHIRCVSGENHAPLLREKKNNVYIWCNSDEFVKKHNLKNCFYTGMIISETEEANMFNIKTTPYEIEESNVLFAKAIKNNIDKPVNLMYSGVISQYNTANNSDVMKFNRKNIYYN